MPGRNMPTGREHRIATSEDMFRHLREAEGEARVIASSLDEDGHAVSHEWVSFANDVQELLERRKKLALRLSAVDQTGRIHQTDGLNMPERNEQEFRAEISEIVLKKLNTVTVLVCAIGTSLMEEDQRAAGAEWKTMESELLQILERAKNLAR